MQIPKELLSEKNYEGSRLIPIEDETISKLFEERAKKLKEGEPILKKMDALSPPVDAFYAKLRPIEEERRKIKEEMQPAVDAFQEVVDEMDTKIYQKTQLIDQKLNPLVAEYIKDKLGEFESAKTMVERDGKLYVEVVDEIEEKVKALRAVKK